MTQGHDELNTETPLVNESGTVGRMTALIEPICADLVVELVDVEFNHGVLKVVIDEQDGLNSQTLVDMTKEISRMIDREDPIPGRFHLEVTSPGVERPLKKPHHFVRAIDSDVAIKTEPSVEGGRRIVGLLTHADDERIVVETADGERTLTYNEIRSAKTIFDWGPTPKPGKAKAKTASPKSPATKPASSTEPTPEAPQTKEPARP